ncbi:unnamed protein product [Lampetra planeri]
MSLREELLKSIWHAFTALDADKSGKVSKSQLKVLSYNLCTVLNVSHDPVALEAHFRDDDSGPVSSQGYMPYLNTYILDKVQKGGYDKCQFDEVCWMIAAKKNFLRNRADAAIISHNDAFKLWRIFNFLSEDTYPLIMVPEEVEFLLRKLVAAMGGDWQSAETPELRMLLGGSKRSSSAEERGGGGVSVWELLSFLDAQPLTPGLEPRAVSFAIDDVHEEFLLDVMKKGSLSKKGHRRKNWMERWFVLRPGTMSYYLSEHQKEKKGDIVLERPCSVSSIVDKDGRKCLFMIKGLEKSFEISASDPRQKQEWITALQASIRLRDEGKCSPHAELRQRRREERGRRREEQAELARRMTELQAARDTQNRELQQLAQAHREAEARAVLEEQLRLQSQVELQKRYEFELLKEKQVIAGMEAEMAVRALEAEMQQRRIHELEEMHTQLRVALEAERRSKRDEEAARELQARLLQEEAAKRHELERLRQQQELEMEVTRQEKAVLEMERAERDVALREAGQQLEQLEQERQQAQLKYQEASERLASASTRTQSWRERVKECESLLRPIRPGDRPAAIVSHRGQGAFTKEEFNIYRKKKESVDTGDDGEEVAAASAAAPIAYGRE